MKQLMLLENEKFQLGNMSPGPEERGFKNSVLVTVLSVDKRIVSFDGTK
jgi:hypothetical protein